MKAKLILSCLLAAGLVSSARAQLFGPETSRNILLGGIAGAIIGDNNHHQAAAGALFGATAGYLWSQATVPAGRPVVVTARPPAVVYARSPACPPPPVVCYRACPAPVRVVVVAPAGGYCHRTVVVHSRRHRWHRR
ncbi:MAG: hypothetical protein PHE83_01395 [Opitutaceae bacterium]|nr:hypothetical protein [Opitutaceae bacterium]